jgi:hypothetical protein
VYSARSGLGRGTRLLGRILLLACVPAVAQADVQLSLSHQVVSVDPLPEGAVLTVDVTVKNVGDESLGSVTLQPGGLVYTSPADDQLQISDLYAGSEQSARWVLHTSQTEQLDDLRRMIGITADVVNAEGVESTLSVSSTQGD